MSKWYKTGLPPDVKAARKLEQIRRASRAQRTALRTLTVRYPDEYRELYLGEKARINAECGPLPGDDDE